VAWIRWLALMTIGVLATSILVQASASWAIGQQATTIGRIAFMRFDVDANDQFVYTINPDGTHEERLLPYPAEHPHWSPDGRELVVECCDDGSGPEVRIVTVESGATRSLKAPEGIFLGCQVWTVDGARLLCGGFGDTEPGLNGVYSIRASDGGDAQRVTTNLDGDDIPQDLAPDGAHLVFISDRDSGALFVVGLDGGGLRRIDTGGLLDVSSASWSPDGDWILFPARKAAGHRGSLFVVHSDGSGLHEIAIDPGCGGSLDDRNSRGCVDPTWSPDGSKILLAILNGYNSQKQLYTIDADGSHLTKVTRHGFVHDDPSEGEQAPDWGSHPLQ
jgi:TolB protein